jgi:FkbM family methyltransferase
LTRIERRYPADRPACKRRIGNVLRVEARPLTGHVPRSLKRRIPAVRERDRLRSEVRDLRARVDELEQQRLDSHADPTSELSGALHGIYVGEGRVLIAPLWGGRLHAHSDDLSLTPELVVHGTYDVPFTSFVQRHIKAGDTVFDIGANIGLFTLLLGYQVWEHGTVVAYEANPRVLPILRDNVSMNWFSDRVEIVPKAAAASAGTLPFLVPSRFDICGSLKPIEHLLSTVDRRSEVERVGVETEPLDVHVGRFERIALIKIDVEGAEEQVFAGMEGLLDSGVVKTVSFEIARSHIGDDWQAFSERLQRLRADGWAFGTISASGDPEPASLDDLFSRAQVSQVLMTRETF